MKAKIVELPAAAKLSARWRDEHGWEFEIGLIKTFFELWELRLKIFNVHPSPRVRRYCGSRRPLSLKGEGNGGGARCAAILRGGQVEFTDSKEVVLVDGLLSGLSVASNPRGTARPAFCARECTSAERRKFCSE